MKHIIPLVTLLLLLVASGVEAQPAPCPGNDMGPHSMAFTPEQRAKYYALQDEYAPKFREIKDQLFIKQNELKALLHSTQPDIPAVRATSAEIVRLRNAKADLRKDLDQRIAKEFGIVRPPREIPGVDCPFGGHRGPQGHFGRGPHGPGPHGGYGGSGPCGQGPHGPGSHGGFGPHGQGPHGPGPHGGFGPCAD